jgi:4-hydroxybenzoate polyprenyltransferase
MTVATRIGAVRARRSPAEWVLAAASATRSARLFIRFSAIGFSAMLPVIGAASTGLPVTPLQTLLLMTAGCAFHCFAYVMNDVVDLPLDRAEPRRADFPLVRGTVTPSRAVAFALVQVHIAALCALLLSSHPLSLGTLAAGVGFMAVYNLWGKRTRWPILTDFSQALAWSALVLFGALAVGGITAASLTLLICGFVAVLIMLANGVHGALRDLPSDVRLGMRTTAVVLGARAHDGALLIPLRLRVYAFVLQSLLTVLAVAVALHHAGTRRMGGPGSAVCVLLLGAWCAIDLLRPHDAAARSNATNARGFLQLAIALGLLLIALIPHVSPGMLIIVTALYIGPLLTHSLLYDTLRWIRLRGRAPSGAPELAPDRSAPR